MRRTLARIIAAALVSVLWRAAGDPAIAKVVRDSKAAPANPAVEVGGYRPAPAPSPVFPVSLIGAIAADKAWRSRCIGAPWAWSRPLFPGHHILRGRTHISAPPRGSSNGFRAR